jgi:hypothetical protein
MYIIDEFGTSLKDDGRTKVTHGTTELNGGVQAPRHYALSARRLKSRSLCRVLDCNIRRVLCIPPTYLFRYGIRVCR